MKDRRFTTGLLVFCLAVPAVPPAAAQEAVKFTDITAAAGIKFTHNSGKAGKKWLPETMGPGNAFFDADGDGWLDILLINGKDWTPKPGKKTTAALYKNNKNGTFTDITAGSGLDVELYGFGVAVGDYDNDGRDDLYITALNGDRLFHNDGAGKFRDVTRTIGIANSTFSASSAWLDYDKDGKLDLFVGNYVAWTAAGDVFCSLDGKAKSYCTPESYKGLAPKLYHNLGTKFEDVTATAGLVDTTNKALGVGTFDYNNDGWTDIFVANDGTPNKLYRNLQNGKFKDEGLAAGVALAEDGTARGAMGVDFADYDRSGRMHLIVGNFSNQMLGLYHNEGNGVFMDQAPGSPVGRASLLSLTFGVFFFDYDLDGYPDFLAANGHIEEGISKVQPKIQFAQLPLLMRNSGKGKFDTVNAFATPIVARGSAYGDFDKDGDLDVLITTNHGPAFLYRNDGGNRNNWLQVKLVGKKSNRNGLGAVVRVVSAGGRQWQIVHSGSSYCSSSDLALTFGLGKDSAATSIEVDWPSGVKQKLGNTPAKQAVVITEQ